MRIKSNFCLHQACNLNERGTALMEFLFALPFLFFILILSVNFCRVMLMKQRATMAVRYVAFTEVHGGDAPTSEQVSTLFFPGEHIEVSAASQSGVPGSLRVPGDTQGQPDTLDAEVQSIDASNRSGLSSFLNHLSGTGSYKVQHIYRPVFAGGDYWGKGGNNWFPTLTISASLTMDSKDWRHDQMSFWKMLKTVAGDVGSLGDILK